jgi:hypothetical protein
MTAGGIARELCGRIRSFSSVDIFTQWFSRTYTSPERGTIRQWWPQFRDVVLNIDIICIIIITIKDRHDQSTNDQQVDAENYKTKSPKFAVEWLTFLLRIRTVRGSNLGHPGRDFRGYPQSLQANGRDITLNQGATASLQILFNSYFTINKKIYIMKRGDRNQER